MNKSLNNPLNKFDGDIEYTKACVSVYDYLIDRCRQYEGLTALSYYGLKVTYSQLFDRIDKIASALAHRGIKQGDVVIVSLPAIPEAVYLFYAINKIGAVFCGMDCRIKSAEISKIIDHINPKLCVVADFHLMEFKGIDSTDIVCIRSTNSIGGFTRFTAFFADLFKGRTFLKASQSNVRFYNDFVREFGGGDTSYPDIKGDDVCAYFYTSGTTYGRKCVVLTNSNINTGVYQQTKANVNISVGDRMLNIMPLFTCYGVTLGTHLPLCLGIEVCLVPLFSPRRMKQLILKHKPSFIITVPSHWDTFSKGNFKGCDLSFLKDVIVGGDKLDPDFENKINSIFRSCGSKAKMINGYGLTETASTAITPTEGTPQGSMGKEMCWTQVRLFELGTDKEVPVGERGEICICGPSVCKGYYNDPVATDNLLKVHSDGKLWLHSGDIAYIDDDGHLFFCERSKRMYVRYDGTKVSPYSIEQLMFNCPVVSQCMVVAVDDEAHTHGKVAKAIVVIKKDYGYNHAKHEINNYIRLFIPEHMKPLTFKIVDKLPTTKNGKLDYFG